MKRTRAGRRSARPVTTHSETDPRDGSRATGSFPIVGIGASAGGLEAFSALLKHLPLDTGMGFVLVQHLDPVHDSALTQLLGRATSLPVHEVTNNLRVEPNHVYVIPPNRTLGITAGVLELGPRPKTRTPHRSIDFFFEALATDQRDRAIGVILSGTATDGTVGLEAIKAEGGITFAQDESARYDSMPRSAVAAGSVDFVLSPEDIATELARIATHPAVIGALSGSPTEAEADRASAIAHEDDETPLPSGGRTPPTGAQTARAEADRGARETRGDRAEEGFKKILLLLRRHSSVDFSLYKSSTIQRRIVRRMVLTKHDTLERYAHFLHGNDKELTALYSDVLISVTSFFRNPEAFEVLRRKVWPALLQQRGDEPLRVWTLGCSTGQEAYSIAMWFVEAADKAPRMRKLQVFATDLNDALLDKARHGLYAKNIAQDLSPERLRRFFVEEEGGYRVGKALREMIVFARQNVMSDPPFSRLDIISCRNLLIYFEPGLQKQVFPVFHYALKPGGYLYLGASESIGGFTDLFEPLDKKHKIYTRKAATTPAFHLPKDRGEPARVSRQIRVPLQQRGDEGGAAKGFRGELSAQREADRVSVNQFAPPAVLINADLQILQFRGPTAAYLEPPTGKASFDLLKMARSGLMMPLRSAINRARKENATAHKEHVRIEENGQARSVDIEVIPLKNLRERCFLVVFKEADGNKGAQRGGGRSRHTSSARADRAPRAAESRRNARLEAELAEMRDYAQSIQEQHEAANEELQASNEEVESANEELQSVNEELETSKEELESANEELTTVNEEMANRHAELNRLHSDLINIQTSAQQAIVLLGRDLTIRRFSVPAEKQLNLMASDVGRPFSHVRHTLAGSDLDSFITGVIDTVGASEREVQDKDGRWFSLRVRPYMTPDNRVDGAVLVLVDINDLKRSELAIASAREYAENIIGTMREPLLVLDPQLRVESVNRAFYRTFEVTPADTIGKFIYALGNGQWDIPGLRALLEEILPENHAIEDYLVEWDFEHLGRRSMLVNARRMQSAEGSQGRIVMAVEDVTERKQIEETLRDADRRKNEFLAMLAHELRNPLAPILASIDILRRAKGLEDSDPEGRQRRSDGLARSDDLSGRIDHALDVLERQVGQMVRLVDDLLDAGRISRGKIDLRRERVELSSVVYQAVDAARAISERRSQELTVTLPGVPLYVDGDSTRLGQIVGNLLNNACKFTERGGHVWLTVEREQESGADRAPDASAGSAPQVVISVRDTGIGIAAEQLDHVFEMFTQVDTSLERSLTGLGIGLTLVKTLVEMHGGTVEVHSAGAGQGSEFVVRLPLVEPDTASRPAPTQSVPTTPLRVLIVDDSHDAADMLAMLLQLAGHETYTAHDGPAAVEAAATQDPDVILLDIGLPIFNGYEAARRIREQHGHQRRPLLIALTGWGQEEDRRRSEEAGFDAHLVKPVDDAFLGRLLAEHSAAKHAVRD